MSRFSTVTHPDLPAEQAYLDAAYDCLDRMRDTLLRSAAERADGEQLVAALSQLLDDDTLARAIEPVMADRREQIGHRRQAMWKSGRP